ncbi:choice-of-anchor Q domain-containing protein [Pseudopedobacter beijingensis]|uniref:Choice-of-anchor Q domain-containing protein n=1 Tax=Pseudopedobacter beijingensis TaxID=1207056 RepID=A0ABW4I921_9SPHI
MLLLYINVNAETPDANGIVYVNINVSGGDGNGNSWPNATTNLQAAINATGVTQVFVAIGNYPVGANSFIMKNGVAIYGGFDPDNNIRTLNDSRILPNLGSGSVLNGQNVRPVIWNVFTSSTKMNGSAVLDGFTIMNGSYNADGAGIRNIYASPTLRNLVIKNNTANYGGGIANTSSSSPVLTNVSIVDNTATSSEGAAGMYNTLSSSPVLTNVTIVYNKATASNAVAGGVRNSGAASTPAFYNCIIWGNTINGNASTSQADIGGSVAALKNSITQSYNTNNTADNNLVGTDPKFTDVTNKDYTLSAASPAIDAGKNSWFVGLDANTKDLVGNARVYNFTTGGTIDMGAYESPYEAVGPLRPDAAGIIYVSPTGVGNGSSWDKATFDLHNAIHTNGVQKVFVAIGNYDVGEHSFIMQNGVAIYGGFDPGHNIRTLSDSRILPNLGMGAGSILNGQNVRPVIWNVFDSGTKMDNTAILDGFTITNGKYDNHGAGIRNLYASPTLTNLVITGNNNVTTAYDRGGAGIYMYYSSPIISNVLITDNTSGAQGGGAWADQYSFPVLTNVQITRNKGEFQGGSGYYNDKNASSTLTNVSITDNTSSNGQTGGIYNLGTLKLTNVTLAGNTANNTPTAIYMANNSSIQFDNSIVYGAIAGAGTYTARYSLTEGNTGGINGNLDGTAISATHVFSDFSAGDYTLKYTSPAINAGNNTLFSGLDANTKDLAGNARVYNYAKSGVIDLGAYEYQGEPVLPVTLISFTAKTDGDYAKLQWQTTNEKDNKGFVIYRSGDNTLFTQIGEIPGTYSLQPTTYNFTDTNPLNGNNYYRLVEVDKDGTNTDLGVRTATFNFPLSTFNLYPNPATEYVNITFEAGRYTVIQLHNVQGQLLQIIELQANQSELGISVTDLSGGIYTVILTGEGGQVAKKLMVER